MECWKDVLRISKPPITTRSKLDPNRAIEDAAQGSPEAEAAYNEFHDTIRRVQVPPQCMVAVPSLSVIFAFVSVFVVATVCQAQLLL